MEQYLEATTVHGFSYLHSRNSWATRILWTNVIVIGFAFAGYLIHESVLDWDSRQTITTLESIATPLYNNVPFPTVTVCPHEDDEPDNWAFVEKIFDSVEFFEEADKSEKTDKSEKVREEIVNPILEKLFEKLLSLYFKDKISFAWVQKEMNIKWKSEPNELSEFVCRKKINQDDMKKATIYHFSRHISFFSALYRIQKDDSPDICNNECCQEWLQAIDFNGTIISGYFMYRGTQRLGSFLSNFGHLTSAKIPIIGEPWSTFSLDSIMIYNDFLNVPISRYCENMSSCNIFLQNYLKELGVVLGFSKTGSVSLFDLPSMLFSFNAKEWNKKYGNTGMLNEQNIPFPYSQCKAGTLETFDQCSKLAEKSVCHMNMSLDANQPCCNFWTQSLQNNLKPIMMVMKMASRRGQSHFNTTEFIKPFASQMNITRYPLKIKDPVMMRDKSSYLPACSYSSGLDAIEFGPESNCTLFKPVVTDGGICYSFNAKPTHALLKDSIFKQTMQEVYKLELGGTTEIQKAKGAGDKFALRFWVDNSRYFKKKKETKPYKVLLSSADGYMNILSNGIDAKPGYETTFLVQPIQVVASENVHNVEKEYRKCSFPDEANEDSIFSSYSQSSCELECKIKFAREKCHCTPWNIPSPASLENPTICDLFGSYCFRNEITNVSILETCINSCPLDCNNVRFDVIVERRTQIDTYLLCRRTGSVYSVLYVFSDPARDTTIHIFDKKY